VGDGQLQGQCVSLSTTAPLKGMKDVDIWELKPLARAVLTQAGQDLRRAPCSSEHQSAKMFIDGLTPEHRELKTLWTMIAFLPEDD
jgi:hypothetical protein